MDQPREQQLSEPSPGGSGGPPETPAASPGDVFDEILKRGSQLYKGSLRPLQEDYVPSRLLHRDTEIRDVLRVLAPAVRGNLPSHLFIYGKVGTGKSAVVTQVQKEFAKRLPADAKVTFLNLNCANVNGEYAVLQNLANQIVQKGLSDEDMIPTGWSQDRVYQALCRLSDKRGGVLLLVLDEIDCLGKSGGTDAGTSILYTLAQINRDLREARVGIIGISNDLQFAQRLDARVKSRLSEEKVSFAPYTQPQLRDILKERAAEVFVEGALDNEALDRCALYAAQDHGDARRALALLRKSAEVADQLSSHTIRSEHVIHAKNKLELDVIADCVRKLTLQHKILLWVVISLSEKRRGEGVSMGEVYHGYSTLCHQLGHKPLGTRTVADYVTEFETLGLVHTEIHSGGRRGRTRLISSAVPSHETLRVLEEDPTLRPLSRQRTFGQTDLWRFDGQTPGERRTGSAPRSSGPGPDGLTPIPE
ncbi:MAG: AAA family ATPase [Euryarchaeota archaeon]|nr:AAA family ATPase [Euryarchaeota archaeon]